jgi:iron(III) transport system permease protein
MPAMLFAAVLVFFLGFELFGLPLVLGDPGHLVLSTQSQADQQAGDAVT